jgi:endonuclease YncB( thermonuclease family)
MDSIGLSLLGKKIEQHRQNRERLLAEVLEQQNPRGLYSSHTIWELYRRTTEYNGVLAGQWREYYAGSWERLAPWLPRREADAGIDEAVEVLQKEQDLIDQEIRSTLTARNFQFTDKELEAGRRHLAASCEVLKEKNREFVETLRSRRKREIGSFWIAKGADFLIPMTVAIFSVWYATRATEQEVKSYQILIEKVVKWTIKSPEQLEKEIEHERQLLNRKKEEIRELIRQKESKTTADFSSRNMIRSGGYQNRLKQLKQEEARLLRDAESEAAFKSETLKKKERSFTETSSMAKDMVLSNPQAFEKLVTDIQKLIDQGREKVKAAANAEYLRTFWAVGGRIEVEGLTENAGYGQSVMEKLAERLKTDRTTLVRCSQLYRLYPKGAPDSSLTWSHWKMLLALGTDKERSYYQGKAEAERWTRDRLSKAIQGELYSTPKGEGKKVKKLPRATSPLFTYRAEVRKVTDGDTAEFLIDLGFQVWKRQKIRFAGVDALPLKEGGDEALDYVQAQLGKAKTVVIQTHKIDIYGRYVGWIFYSLDENDTWEKVFASGRFLNQELLDRGLARAV